MLRLKLATFSAEAIWLDCCLGSSFILLYFSLIIDIFIAYSKNIHLWH
jgi:hypothetical protein